MVSEVHISCKIELHECYICRGLGYIKYYRLVDVNSFTKYIQTEVCPICNGRGNLNWLENIFGVSDDK